MFSTFRKIGKSGKLLELVSREVAQHLSNFGHVNQVEKVELRFLLFMKWVSRECKR